MAALNQVRTSHGAADPAQAGFTMVEVLVAVLVLSIGLIGLASLQGVSLQFNNSAYLRSQATNLAYDMADRVRANRQVALTTAAYNLAPADAAPIPGDLASADLAEWRNALQTMLPAGTGGVTVGAGGALTVVVCWDDTRGEAIAGAPADCPGNLMGFRFETQL